MSTEPPTLDGRTANDIYSSFRQLAIPACDPCHACQRPPIPIASVVVARMLEGAPNGIVYVY
jgi:hypothetical protein